MREHPIFVIFLIAFTIGLFLLILLEEKVCGSIFLASALIILAIDFASDK